MPLKRGQLQPGDSGRGTRNPSCFPARRVFCFWRPYERQTEPRAASPPRSSMATATPRSSTARCTSLSTCPSRTASATRATWRPCSRADRPASSTAGRATRPPPRSRRRSTRWRRASPPSASRPAWRRSRRFSPRFSRRAITSSSSHFLFGNTNSLFQTLESHGDAGDFRRCDDVRASRRRSRRRRGWCSSRRSPTRARRSPTSRGSASCALRAASSTSWTTR